MQSEQPWLFPEAILSNRVKSVSYTATMVGDIFEVMSQALLGGERIHADGSADGMYANGERLWESKAAQTRHYFKLTAPQTNRHLHNRDITTDFLLWAYRHPLGDGKGGLTAYADTVRDIVKWINENITIVHVIPGEVLPQFLGLPATKYREYDSWKDQEGLPYRVYQIPHFVLDSTRWNGRFPQKTKVRHLDYTYCGEKFRTELFTVVEHARPQKTMGGEIPF